MLVRFQRFPVMSSLFDPLTSVDQEVDDLFDRFWPASIGRPAFGYPAVDMTESDKESVVVAEIPGVRKEDLKLSIHDGVLTLSGERKPHQLPENASWLRNESRSGEFSRTIPLPHDVRTDAVSAELTDGVLRVVLPKAEEIMPREITIK